jgi:hypothetical protein
MTPSTKTCFKRPTRRVRDYVWIAPRQARQLILARMATENSPSGIIFPSPSPREKIFPVPVSVPVKGHRKRSLPIPEPERGMHPRRDPRPRYISWGKKYSEQSRRRNIHHKRIFAAKLANKSITKSHKYMNACVRMTK